MQGKNSATLAAGLALACALFIGNAMAETIVPPPPVRPTVDANGVNVFDLSYQSPVPMISIGQPGAGGLTYRAVIDGEIGVASVGEYAGGISATNDGTTITATVSFENYSETFTSPSVSPHAYVSAQGTGGTLTETSTNYTYVGRDGTVVIINKTSAVLNYAFPNTYISSITLPTGEIRNFNYITQVVDDLGSSTTRLRLQSVTNNFGYQIKFGYAYNGTGEVPSNEENLWYALTSVTAINMAVDYCDPLASGCSSLTQPWPTLSYSVGNLISGCSGSQENTANPSNCGLSVTDKLGRVITYGSTGSNSSVEYGVWTPGRSSPSITFSAPTTNASNLSVSRNGQTWNYTYVNASGVRTTTVTDPLGRNSIYVFDTTTNALKSYTNTAGETTSYQLDGYGRPTQVTLPDGETLQYAYDGRGNITRTTLVPADSESPMVWASSFDATCVQPKKCNKPNSTVDPTGGETDYTYDPNSGNVATVTLPAPTQNAVRPQVRYTYSQYQAYYKNSSGSLVADPNPVHLLAATSTCRTSASCTGTVDELKTVMAYGSTGVANNLLPTSSTVQDGTGSLVATTQMEFDVFGNQTAVDGPLGSAVQRVTTQYDALRRVTGTVGPDPDGSGSRPNIGVRITYDTFGNPATVDAGTLSGQSTSAWQSFSVHQSITRQFDAEGRVTQSTVSAGGTTQAVEQTSYDAVGRATCKAVRVNLGSVPSLACTASSGSAGTDQVVQYGYDSADRLTTVTTGYGSSHPVVQKTLVWASGNLLQSLADGRGALTTYSHDGFGRVSQVHYPNPNTIGAASSTDYEQFTYDSSSNLVSIRRRSGDVIQLSRDLLGRVTERIVPTSAEDVYFTYDNQGRVLSALYGNQSGNGITQGYDGLGRVTSRSVFGRTLGYGYDIAGRRTKLTYPDGFYVNYGYSNLGELVSVSDSTGATLGSYGYDAMGARTLLSHGNGVNTTYTQDALERLSQMTLGLSSSSYNATTAFVYSPAGQILSKTQSNDAYTWLPSPLSQTVGEAVNGQNQLTSFKGVTVARDSNGDVVSGVSGLTYGYDVLGQLRQGSSSGVSISVDYDPSGMLRREINGGTETDFLYDGQDLIAEYVGGNVVRRFIHGAGTDEPIVWYEGATPSSSTRKYLHADERGSIITTTDASGNATGTVAYSPYGESGTPVSAFGYTGQLYLSDLQLYYYKARMYSPATGRFLQPDPAGYAAGMNLYAYADGDPLNEVDPSGLDGCLPEFQAVCEASGGNNPPMPYVLDPVVSQASPYTSSCDAICLQQQIQMLFPQGGIPTGMQIAGISGVSGGAASQAVQRPQTDPCVGMGNAPSPQQYAAQGQADAQYLDASVSAAGFDPSGAPSLGLAPMITSLSSFRRGSSLDAQSYNSPCYSTCVAYGNYAYGVYMAASGWSLSFALSGANYYAALRSTYPPQRLNPNSAYPAIPLSNVANVTAGYNAYQSGTLCVKH